MNSLCVCRRSCFNKPVRNGLAMTPAQVYESYKRGIPVALSTLSSDSFVEQSDDNCFDVPLEFQRGSDLNTCFEHQFNFKREFNKEKLFYKEIDN